MEELFLRLGLVLQEVDVVDEENIRVAVAVLEALRAVLPQRLNEVVGEALHGDVEDLQVVELLMRPVADGLDEMGLTQSDAAVDQAGVVAGTGVTRDRHG